MKTLIKIAILAVVILVGYNYFYGNDKEQEQAHDIVDKLKGLGQDIADLVRNEKEQIDEGKYDDALDKISEIIDSVKEKVSQIDLKEELKELEKRKEELGRELENIKEKKSDDTNDDLKKLNNDLDDLMKDLDVEVKKILDNI